MVESGGLKHNSLARLLDYGNFRDTQLTNSAGLQFATNHFELSTEMNSGAGSMSSLQEIHLKQAGSCSEPAKISRRALGTAQNGARYIHPTCADETGDNFREINILQKEVTALLPSTAGKFSQLLQKQVTTAPQDASYRP